MKSLNFTVFSLFVSVIFGLTACNPSTQIRVLQPAEFAVPEYIKTIVTVNRSVPKEVVGSIIEGAITGEGIYQDRDAAMQAIAGLTESLTRTPRFAVKSSGVEFEGGGIRGMPMPISWQEIERLCATYNADAVAALEVFDTDIHTDFVTHEKKETKSTEKATATTTTNSNSGTRPTANSSNNTTSNNNTTTNSHSTNGTKTTTNQSDRGGTKAVSTIEYEATLYSTTKLGWRLYDPKNKRVIDEFMVSENQKWNEREATKEEVMRKLPNPRDAVNATSKAAGRKYGSRIAPMWASVAREYYKKGGEQMERAYRMTRNDKWKDAAAIWQPLTKSNDHKVAGMACYNMAIACEVEGQLNIAREWAMQAYEKHNNKRARTYANSLRTRIAAQQRVNEQMNRK